MFGVGFSFDSSLCEFWVSVVSTCFFFGKFWVSVDEIFGEIRNCLRQSRVFRISKNKSNTDTKMNQQRRTFDTFGYKSMEEMVSKE